MNRLVIGACWLYFKFRDRGARKSVAIVPMASVLAILLLVVVHTSCNYLGVSMDRSVALAIALVVTLPCAYWVDFQHEDAARKEQWQIKFDQIGIAKLRIYAALYFITLGGIVIGLAVLDLCLAPRA